MSREGYVKFAEEDYIALENDLAEKLRLFFESHINIYIYGAGDIGKRMYVFCQRHNLDGKIAGFLISDVKPSSSMFCGLPVLSVLELYPRANVGIVLSLAVRFHEKVRDLLKKKEIGDDDTLAFSVAEYEHIYRCNRRLSDGEAAQYLSLYPPKKYSGQSVKEWKRILLIAADAIGDEMINIPFIRNLRQNCSPGTKITAVVRPSVASFMKYCPYLDILIPCDLSEITGQTVEECAEKAKSFVEKYLQEESYDAVFLHGWFDVRLEYFLLALFSDAPIRIGYSERNNPRKSFCNKHFDQFLSLAATSTDVMNEVERDARLLEFLGARIFSLHLEFWTAPEDEIRVEQIFYQLGLQGRKVLALVPQALDPTRMWDKRKYLHLLQRVAASHNEAVFLIIGGKDASEVGDFLVREISLGKIVNLAGKTTLCEVAEIFKRCCMYIGCNTGLLHIAAAEGIPTVEIICHSEEGNPLEYPSPDRYRAWGNESYVIRPKKALPGCGATCYAGEAHCINQVKVDEVFTLVDNILKRRSGTYKGM